MPNIQHKRGSRTDLDALAGTSGLKEGQVYVLSDEDRLTVATSTSTHTPVAKEAELPIVLTQVEYDALTPVSGQIYVVVN